LGLLQYRDKLLSGEIDIVDFLENILLPKCPAINSVIVMDNKHYAKGFASFAGVILVYLPPYSPDYM
jgi:transposase